MCVALFGVAKLIFKRGTSGPSKKKRVLAARQSIQAMAHSGATAVAHGSMNNSEVDYDLINGNYTKEQSAMFNRAMGQSDGSGQNVGQGTRQAAVANCANEKAPAERTLANSVADNSPLGRMYTKAKLESQRQSVNQFEMPKRKEKLAYSDGPIKDGPIKSAKAGLFSRKRKRDAYDPFARIATERNSY